MKSWCTTNPSPQTSHLCGLCSECTVICVKSPPLWVKLMPHNSHVNLRTAKLKKKKTFWNCAQSKYRHWYNLRAFGGIDGLFSRLGNGAPCLSFMWLSRWIFRRNRFLQMWHSIVGYCVWILMWAFNSFLRLNLKSNNISFYRANSCLNSHDLWHIQHSNGRSLLCIVRWAVSVHFKRNRRPHSLHAYWNSCMSNPCCSVSASAFSLEA